MDVIFFLILKNILIPTLGRQRPWISVDETSLVLHNKFQDNRSYTLERPCLKKQTKTTKKNKVEEKLC